MALQEIKVPELGDVEDVAVVEVYLGPGDTLEVETPLISLESDKAVMDVPSPVAGTIREMKVAEGDKVNAGDLLAMVEVDGEGGPSAKAAEEKDEDSIAPGRQADTPQPASPPPDQASPMRINNQAMGAKYHATPSVRSFSRELGVDLSKITGTGPKGRIKREDVSALVKSVMAEGVTSVPTGSFSLPPIPGGDYEAFGEVETEGLSRIKRISGPHLHRNWVGIPHVTQFEEADITDLEDFRGSLNQEGAKTGDPRISPLIFILKAAVQALKKFPDFNSSLNSDGVSITRKKYYNIGIAVDTPGGLVVPVVKDVDAKGIRSLAGEVTDLSGRAREGRLKADEMRGATFTISSLGGIGGTYFTPIINAPEAAILGLSKSAMKPLWDGKEFVPRLILPFSVSYDHRVIDGAQGARFAAYLALVVGDIRRALL